MVTGISVDAKISYGKKQRVEVIAESLELQTKPTAEADMLVLLHTAPDLVAHALKVQLRPCCLPVQA
jgi:hypothetical protein